MITTLVLVLIVLVLALWIIVMRAIWKQEQGMPNALFSLAPLEKYADKMRRFVRRGYYGSMLYGKFAANWGNKRLGNVFFTLFPNAEPAFAKRNNLAGLKEGPTSYFLMSISETKSDPQKITRRRKKIV